MIILIAVVFSALTALDLDHQTWGQQSNDISQIQESLDNISSQTGEEVDHLEMIGEEFAKLKQGQIVSLPLCNRLLDGFSICNIWIVHRSGAETFALYKETLPSSFLCTGHSCHRDTFAIHYECYV